MVDELPVSGLEKGGLKSAFRCMCTSTHLYRAVDVYPVEEGAPIASICLRRLAIARKTIRLKQSSASTPMTIDMMAGTPMLARSPIDLARKLVSSTTFAFTTPEFEGSANIRPSCMMLLVLLVLSGSEFSILLSSGDAVRTIAHIGSGVVVRGRKLSTSPVTSASSSLSSRSTSPSSTSLSATWTSGKSEGRSMNFVLWSAGSFASPSLSFDSLSTGWRMTTCCLFGSLVEEGGGRGGVTLLDEATASLANHRHRYPPLLLPLSDISSQVVG